MELLLRFVFNIIPYHINKMYFKECVCDTETQFIILNWSRGSSHGSGAVHNDVVSRQILVPHKTTGRPVGPCVYIA